MIVVQLLVLWLLCATTGWGFACLLLPRGWTRERALLAPVFGAGALVLLSGVSSYAGIAMRSAVPVVLACSAGASIACMLAARGRHTSQHRWRADLFVHAAGFVGGATVLLSVLLYHAWNPYSDAFTHISIADFLQTHSFFAPAEPTGDHPLLTQIWLYRGMGARMGSTFFLAFAAALFRADFSFDVYLPVLALGLWLAVPGFFVLCRRGLFMTTAASGVATTLYALHTGIPITNALAGFLPQTWGLVFLFPLLALHVRATSAGDWLRRVIAPGVLGGVLLLTYTEIVPFALLSVGTCYLVRLMRGRLRFPRALVCGAGPIAVAIMVAPLSAWKFLSVIIAQSKAVVGADLGLSLFDYLVMLPGYRSMAQARLMAPGFLEATGRAVAIVAVVTAAFAAFRGPLKTRRQLWLLAPAFAIPLAWFALYAVNPWNPLKAGQPWNTYKVVTYSFQWFVVLWAIGLVSLWRKGPVWRALTLAQLAAFLAFFAVASRGNAISASKAMREFTGNDKDPIAEYLRLPQLLADLPPDQPVNLLIPANALKHRQMVAYFLRRPVIADWSDDVYIGPHIIPSTRYTRADVRYPTLIYAPADSVAKVANLRLQRDATLIVESTFGPGWYDQESDGHNWWRWLEQEGEIDLVVHRGGRLTMDGQLAVVAASQRVVSVRFLENPDMNRNYTLTQRWFTPFSTDAIHVAPGVYRVLISADGTSHTIGDSRQIRIGVRNLSWTLVPD